MLIVVIPIITMAQENNILINTDWDHERHAWDAVWIAHPQASAFDYGVFIFRNSFMLEKIPNSVKAYVSADNRYRLFVNGNEVSMGPARGDFMHWRYETIDIAPFLKIGRNVIAAEVFNQGEYRPVAQFSRQTAFIFQVDGELGKLLDTGRSRWQVAENKAYHVRPVTREMASGKYYVAGPCDSIVGKDYIWGWFDIDLDDSNWLSARNLELGVGRGYMHGVRWLLVPRNIPMLEQKKIRFETIVRSSLKNLDVGFLKGIKPLTIQPNSSVKILLDQNYLTIGYPEILISGGKGSKIKVTYSESLYQPDKRKGNRNETDGKEIYGYSDIVMPDGGNDRFFRPLWLRTYRFVQLEIETGNNALTIKDYYTIFTAYPFSENASFESNDTILSDIWNVGWRTARLCASETYMDCPYWEQLQYIGDTRIQALISLYVSGDDRLMRNALELIDHSRITDGLTMGRAPSAHPQITPPFSLYWVDMVHDYYQHRTDDAFIKQFLPGMQSVLTWFENRIESTGMLGALDWFSFTDWTSGFKVGAPDGADAGHSALLSLNFVYALDRATELFHYFKRDYEAKHYQYLANQIRASVWQNCYVKSKGLIADTPDKNSYSQHTNIFAILTNCVPENEQKALCSKILTDTNLIQTTIYFKFYLFRALQHCGMYDKYLDQLQPWKTMLAKGLTTWEEGDYDERSDCHAWGASPNYDLLAGVCGIQPDSPGFKTVKIEPSLGKLKYIKVKMPHPSGTIEVDLYKTTTNGIQGVVTLPPSTTGIFVWHSEVVTLKAGVQKISIN